MLGDRDEDHAPVSPGLGRGLGSTGLPHALTRQMLAFATNALEF